jgi:hypothetical protein
VALSIVENTMGHSTDKGEDTVYFQGTFFLHLEKQNATGVINELFLTLEKLQQFSHIHL